MKFFDRVVLSFRKNSLVLAALLGLASLAQAQTYTADQYFQAGSKCYQDKNYSQALTYLNAAVQLNPSYGAAHQLRGNCYYYMGDKTSAAACYQQAYALDPSNAALGQTIAGLQAASGANPVNVQFQMNMSTTGNMPIAPQQPVQMAPAAPPQAAVSEDDDDSEIEASVYYDKAKSRKVVVKGKHRRAFLTDTSAAHTMEHVFLCDNVSDVEFITDGEGKAWRINLTQANGGSKDYDGDGHLLTSNP